MDYNESPIQVHTSYSYSELKAFLIRTSRKVKYISLVIAAMFAYIFIGLLLEEDPVLYQDSYPLSIGLVLGIFVITLTLFLASNGIFYTKKAYAKANKFLTDGQTFSFMETEFIASNNQQGFDGTSRIAYARIDRVVETVDMFYIFLDKRQAYLVSKDGFQNGTSEELRNILLKNLSHNKYKRCPNHIPAA